MKKAQYDHLPPKMEAIGNGTHFYRWNIKKVTTDESVIWECNEVIISGPPTRIKVTEAVILAKWGTNAEAKLLNDYNAAKEGLLDDTYVQVYKDFIIERKAIKEEITVFFNA